MKRKQGSLKKNCGHLLKSLVGEPSRSASNPARLISKLILINLGPSTRFINQIPTFFELIKGKIEIGVELSPREALERKPCRRQQG